MESLAPFLQGTCTPYNMPVYPGARSNYRRLGDDLEGIPQGLKPAKYLAVIGTTEVVP